MLKSMAQVSQLSQPVQPSQLSKPSKPSKRTKTKRPSASTLKIERINVFDAGMPWAFQWPIKLMHHLALSMFVIRKQIKLLKVGACAQKISEKARRAMASGSAHKASDKDNCLYASTELACTARHVTQETRTRTKESQSVLAWYLLLHKTS